MCRTWPSSSRSRVIMRLQEPPDAAHAASRPARKWICSTWTRLAKGGGGKMVCIWVK